MDEYTMSNPKNLKLLLVEGRERTAGATTINIAHILFGDELKVDSLRRDLLDRTFD